MLLQKSRLRRRALSQHASLWPSVDEVLKREHLWSAVFGTGFALRAHSMNHNGYAGDFPSRTKPTPNNCGATLSVTSCVCLCLSILGWSSTTGLEWEGRPAMQPVHIGGLSSIRGQQLLIFLLLHKQAGSRLGASWNDQCKYSEP